jgi:hypothetical protein
MIDENKQEDGDCVCTVGLSMDGDDDSEEIRHQQQDSSSDHIRIIDPTCNDMDEHLENTSPCDRPIATPNPASSAEADSRRGGRNKLRLRISKSLTSFTAASKQECGTDNEEQSSLSCTPHGLQAAFAVAIPKSVLRKSSSYGCLQPCCQIIPINTKSKAWQQLPAPKFVPCFDNVVHQDLLQQQHPEETSSNATRRFSLMFAVKAVHNLDSSRKQHKQVSWSSVNIREHALTVGDNPSCVKGTPLSLDWSFQQQPAVPIDSYEQTRRRIGGRRHYKELRVPQVERYELLLKHNVTPKEMEKADAIKDKIRRQREKTMELSLFVPTIVEIMVESAIRKVRRSLSRA